MTDDERRAMTDAARAQLRESDLRNVDQWARRTGRHPLPEHERQRWADHLARERAQKASDAAAAMRAQRARGDK